jgi:hypothetical protein
MHLTFTNPFHTLACRTASDCVFLSFIGLCNEDIIGKSVLLKTSVGPQWTDWGTWMRLTLWKFQTCATGQQQTDWGHGYDLLRENFKLTQTHMPSYRYRIQSRDTGWDLSPFPVPGFKGPGFRDWQLVLKKRTIYWKLLCQIMLALMADCIRNWNGTK